MGGSSQQQGQQGGFASSSPWSQFGGSSPFGQMTLGNQAPTLGAMQMPTLAGLNSFAAQPAQQTPQPPQAPMTSPVSQPFNSPGTPATMPVSQPFTMPAGPDMPAPTPAAPTQQFTNVTPIAGPAANPLSNPLSNFLNNQQAFNPLAQFFSRFGRNV